MAVKGVNNSYVFYEKSHSRGKVSRNSFSGKLTEAQCQSEDKKAEDNMADKGMIPENGPMSTEEIMKMIDSRKNEILEKVKKGETEPVIQIGAQAYTEKQWKRMMESFDESEKDIADQIKEALVEARKQRAKGEL